jgi:hypothetical protein
MKAWTAEDIAILTSRYAIESNRSIAQVLGRSETSCDHKASRLGLKKPGAGRFKTGHKPPHWQPIGTERISASGYLERKVSDTGNPNVDFVAAHRLLWEETCGPVAPGHAVVFKDGDRENIAIENLECIDRQELMRRNSIHRYPPEVQYACQLKSVLNRMINKRSQA